MDHKQNLPLQKNSQKRLNKLSSFLKTDRAILMICIGIAFVFWLFTKLSYPFRSQVSIKVEYNLSKDKVLSVPAPELIDITIEASGWELMKFYFVRRKYTIDVDVSDNSPKTLNAAALKAKLLSQFPENVSIIEITPDLIQFKPEDFLVKKVPVRADNQLQLSAQFMLKDSIKVYPDSVEVRGPASIVKGIEFWQTSPLSFNGVESSFVRKVDIRKHSNKNISIFPDRVNVEGVIEQITEKNLEVEITKIGVPDSLLLVLLPQKVNISCIVGLSDFDLINPKDFKITADFSKINLNSITAVKLELEDYPAVVHKIRMQPKEADFIIRSKK
jgi:YbbR domain-containing protein